MHTSAGRMLSPHEEVFFVERAHLFMEAKLEAKLAQLLLPFVTTFEDQLCAMGKSAVESEVIFIRKLLPMVRQDCIARWGVLHYIPPNMPHIFVHD
jgi:hypothetical protein